MAKMIMMMKKEPVEVSYIDDSGIERLAIFHKWTEHEGNDFALVQTVKGTMKYVPAITIRFLRNGEDIPLEDVERMYNDVGILNRDEFVKLYDTSLWG